MDLFSRTLMQALTLLFTFLVVTLGDVNINDPEGDVYELPGGSTTLVLKCTSDGVDMVWYRDNVLLSSEGSVSIVTILDTAIGFSTLRIDGVNSNSSGRYACRNPARGSDEDVITVTVPAPDREIKPIQIVGLPDKYLEVMESETFSITCQADMATQVFWAKNDVRLGDGIQDIAISLVTNKEEMTKTTVLEKSNAALADAGKYSCKDRSSASNSDMIRVHVKPKPKFSAKIVHPDKEEMTITIGKTLRIKCMADPNRQLIWKKDGKQLEAGPNGFIISNAVIQEGKTVSQISKDVVTMDDTGIYVCSNKRIPEDKDSITVTVKDMSDVKTETISVLLRVGETLRLHCTLESAAESVVTWYKDGHQMVSGDAYTVTGNELQIKRSKKSDACIYECHFQQPNSSEVIGIIKHNVTTKLCPMPIAPSNGGFNSCPTKPVYGETCSFKCNDGFTLEGSAKRSCNLNADTSETVWSGKEPVCAVENTQATPTDIPVSTSSRILRVGTKLKLNCKSNFPIKYKTTWMKDEEAIAENPDTYRRHGHSLSVMVTGVQNVGIYKCMMLGDEDGQTLGIQIFNITAKECSVLRPPMNGVVDSCPDSPLYGSICTYKCNPGFSLVGDKQRTCEVKPKGRYYWTGKRPQCKENTEPTEEVEKVSKEEKRHKAEVREAEVRGGSRSLFANLHYLTMCCAAVVAIGILL